MKKQKQELMKMRLQYFAEDKTPKNENVDAQDKGGESKDKEPEKKYSDKEVDEIINSKFAKWQQELAAKEQEKQKAVEEAKRLAQMNEEEKKKYEFEQLQKELAEYKKKDTFYSLSKEASKMLSEHSIQANDELLQLVVKDDAEGTQTAVNAFVGVFNKAVEAQVKEKLSGKAPKVNATPGKMTTKESILSIKDPSERIKAIQENPQLFN